MESSTLQWNLVPENLYLNVAYYRLIRYAIVIVLTTIHWTAGLKEADIFYGTVFYLWALASEASLPTSTDSRSTGKPGKL